MIIILKKNIGDNYYHIQKMKPLAIEKMFVKVDDNLNGNLTNGYMTFMDTFEFKSVKYIYSA